MFNLQRVLNKLLDTPTVKFLSGYCVHARHREHNCRVCVDNCPGKALVLDGLIRFNQDQCKGCGVCAASCPTGAFILASPSGAELMEQLLGRRIVAITCRKGDQSPDMVGVPCLGYLDSQLLAAIVLQGTKVQLDLCRERCASCGGKGISLVLAALKKAQKIIQAFDEEKNLEAVGQGDRAEVELMSREEFLRLYRRKLGVGFKKSVISLLELEDSAETGLQSGPELNREVTGKIALPESRRLLLQALTQKVDRKEREIMGDEDIPFGGLTIKDECTGCGDCTVFCPTGALKKSVREGNISITHRPAHCLKCGLCALGCRNKAIDYLQVLDLADVLSAGEITVYRSTVKRCTECDAEITLQSDSGLCYVCQTKKAIELELDKVIVSKT